MSLTKADYDAWAATYDVVDNPLVAMSTFALEETARTWSGARILELGCGTARNAAPLLAAGASEYVGLDASPEMLARARTNDPRIRLLTGDLTSAPRESFDAAFFCLVLEHFEHLTAPLSSAAHALRPSGELAIFELHPSWWHDGARAHYIIGGQERALASWPHDEPEFTSALAPDFELIATRTWYAHEAACLRSPKLRKRLGRPILLELHARRR
jgi:SAM-dependent methyltransferase